LEQALEGGALSSPILFDCPELLRGVLFRPRNGEGQLKMFIRSRLACGWARLAIGDTARRNRTQD
jgi:hypothetical protein